MSVIALDPNPCPTGWGPGCDSYTGGHACDRDGGHVGRHRCVCGSTTTTQQCPSDDREYR